MVLHSRKRRQGKFERVYRRLLADPAIAAVLIGGALAILIFVQLFTY